MDAIAGIAAGLVLYFGRWVWSPWSGLSVTCFGWLGIVGLCCGALSGTITVLKAYRPLPVWTLILANAAYALVCLGLLIATLEKLTAIGFTHLLAEIVFVGGLAILEGLSTLRPNTWTVKQGT